MATLWYAGATCTSTSGTYALPTTTTATGAVTIAARCKCGTLGFVPFWNASEYRCAQCRHVNDVRALRAAAPRDDE